MSLSSVASRPCKICRASSIDVFGLPRTKRAGHPIPEGLDDCRYYQCTQCNFLFTDAIDQSDHTEIYDETYWANQDPDWHGRVTETFRLVFLANELLKKKGEDLDILDFGSGMGTFVESARNSLQLNVWGTDIITPKYGLNWFLPELSDRKFDVVTACEVIEHLPDPMTVFAMIRRHLKSPGVFAFQTAQWDPGSLNRDWWYLGPHNGHISLYSRDALTHAFTSLGGSRRRLWRNYPGVQAWLFE